MKRIALLIIPILAAAVLIGWIGFSKNWRMDYGKPEAQFHAHDLAAMGKPFLRKMITVQGTVIRVENLEDGNHVFLEHGIHCVFPTWHYGQDDLKPGEVIHVDGFLEKCETGDVLLDPAIRRDSQAPFEPQEENPPH